ncbi:hypothetical protein M0R45_031185 [Rubus argutus]|uniref:Reverse transcriptase domain-containing protein n=1 Tax=Rubus argutus TaxID=59490 RepID=A0AAW1WGI0_RUBAR
MMLLILSDYILLICWLSVSLKSNLPRLRILSYLLVSPTTKLLKLAVFSGGIWLYWNSNNFSVQPIDKNCQSITIKVTLPSGPIWMLTVLYASPTNYVRSNLWNYLEHLVAVHQLPWIFIGDFNELYSSADKYFGTMYGRIGGLKKWVDQNSLIDMGFIGSRFTWSNNRIKERLDRAFCTCDWRSSFPEAFIRHLAKMKSDHCPLLLQLHSNNRVNRAATPFRFQAMWMSHNEFAPYVGNTWKSSSGTFVEKITALSTALQEWNNNTFGNIFKRKKHLLARLGGIQKATDRYKNSFLLKLETKLITEYESLRDQENLFWKQKSRDKRLQGGDRNTKFFHLTTLVRRRRNKIEGLFDKDNQWQTESNTLKSIAVDFFQNLFSESTHLDSRFMIPWLFPSLEIDDLHRLCCPVDMYEVKNAMFSIGGLKAPGYDGFPAGFYQKFWSLYAADIFSITQTAFTSCEIPPGLNHTIISLIPKVTGPQEMAQFRPISLCTTIYKVISKIIVARIRPFMQKLISPNQVSYVPERQISDNIMIAQEILFKFKKSTGHKGFFAWKVDLSKAYDRLSWNFIEKVLYETLLPPASC